MILFTCLHLRSGHYSDVILPWRFLLLLTLILVYVEGGKADEGLSSKHSFIFKSYHLDLHKIIINKLDNVTYVITCVDTPLYWSINQWTEHWPPRYIEGTIFKVVILRPWIGPKCFQIHYLRSEKNILIWAQMKHGRQLQQAVCDCSHRLLETTGIFTFHMWEDIFSGKQACAMFMNPDSGVGSKTGAWCLWHVFKARKLLHV